MVAPPSQRDGMNCRLPVHRLKDETISSVGVKRPSQLPIIRQVAIGPFRVATVDHHTILNGVRNGPTASHPVLDQPGEKFLCSIYGMCPAALAFVAAGIGFDAVGLRPASGAEAGFVKGGHLPYGGGCDAVERNGWVHFHERPFRLSGRRIRARGDLLRLGRER